MSQIFLDWFSGSVAELSSKQRRNLRTVLEVLSRDPNVSTWDMAEHEKYPLWKTIQKLESRGFVISVKRNYPWLRYEVTEEGKKFLSETEGEK